MTISQNKTKNKQTELERIEFEREREKKFPQFNKAPRSWLFGNEENRTIYIDLT